uniref:Protein kinase domain-containing protein n=1 Tax=Haptolina brevifila TaxID=156173 RepID=A0A7S2JA38_9EUKA|mmetsp:Transcript_78650/g.156362  ORF Transcript_78650/g.156362 Transcript_78650/m.156362 type:complete len:676 (+) Transcript_78650:23-2050(+)
MGCGVSRIAPLPMDPPQCGPRLFLYSDCAAKMPRLLEALSTCDTVSEQFSFADFTVANFVDKLHMLVKSHGSFECIALASNGPDCVSVPKAYGDGRPWLWELSRHVVLTDPMQLTDTSHPVRQVLAALGKATTDGGRVDLLNCSLLRTWACPESAWPKLKALHSIEDEACVHFTASTHMLQYHRALQSEDEWVMESDEFISIKQIYLLPAEPVALPDGSSVSMSDSQLEYVKSHGDLVQMAPVHRRYKLGAVLGDGAFGIVRLGIRRVGGTVDETLGPDSSISPKRVAIKIIDKAHIVNLQCIKREVCAMARLDHPHIIRLYEILDAQLKIYLVMELVNGGNMLERILECGPYREREATKLMGELCSALAHVHAVGVLHRDLKPQNVLHTTRARGSPIKVIDFGLAAPLLLPTLQPIETDAKPSNTRPSLKRSVCSAAAASLSHRPAGNKSLDHSSLGDSSFNHGTLADESLVHALDGKGLFGDGSLGDGSFGDSSFHDGSFNGSFGLFSSRRRKDQKPSWVQVECGRLSLMESPDKSDKSFTSKPRKSRRYVVSAESYWSKVSPPADGSGASQVEKVGTPKYMAPEVLRTASYSRASDLWSAGVVLYVSLVAKPPFSGQTVEQTVAQITRGCWDHCEGDEWSSVCVTAKVLIKGLLVNDPTKRLSAAQIVELLA